jgi:dynein heavy chain, axonemal
MKGSPFAKIFEQQIKDWEEWLLYTFNFTNEWRSVQQVWVYLEPIFSSPDIVKHLPMEAGKFRDVDSNWRSLMSRIHQNPQVMEITKNRKLLDLLKECSANLDIV